MLWASRVACLRPCFVESGAPTKNYGAGGGGGPGLKLRFQGSHPQVSAKNGGTRVSSPRGGYFQNLAKHRKQLLAIAVSAWSVGVLTIFTAGSIQVLLSVPLWCCGIYAFLSNICLLVINQNSARTHSLQQQETLVNCLQYRNSPMYIVFSEFSGL